MSFIENPHHYKKAKAVLNILILLVAILIFLFFISFKNSIASSMFPSFILLSVVGLGLLVGLLYLVSNSSAPKKHHPKSKKSSKRKRHKSR